MGTVTFYDMQIRSVSSTAEFYVDHRLPTFPDVETLVLLKEEAVRTFTAMFEHDPEEMYVSLALSQDEPHVFEPEPEEVEEHED